MRLSYTKNTFNSYFSTFSFLVHMALRRLLDLCRKHHATTPISKVRESLSQLDFHGDIYPLLTGNELRGKNQCDEKTVTSGKADRKKRFETFEVAKYLADNSPIRGDNDVDTQYKRIDFNPPHKKIRRSVFHEKAKFLKEANQRSIGTVCFSENVCHSLVLFALPAHTTIPLHDHPSMHVLLRVLCGRIKIRAFDPIGSCVAKKITGTSSGPPFGNSVAVHCVYDRWVSSEENVLQIHPNAKGGVFHEISTQDEVGVFIDYITPPYYTAPLHLPCTYYNPRKHFRANAS